MLVIGVEVLHAFSCAWCLGGGTSTSGGAVGWLALQLAGWRGAQGCRGAGVQAGLIAANPTVAQAAMVFLAMPGARVVRGIRDPPHSYALSERHLVVILKKMVAGKTVYTYAVSYVS